MQIDPAAVLAVISEQANRIAALTAEVERLRLQLDAKNAA